MRRLCDAEHIPCVDMTAVFEARLQAGENVYFPDESHLNESGEALVAETLVQFLRPAHVEEEMPVSGIVASGLHVMHPR